MVVIVQYLLGILVPIVLVLVVAQRTRPGLVRRFGMAGFILLALAGVVGVATALLQRGELALLQAALTFFAVVTAVVAVIIGSIQTKADDDS